MNMLEIKNVTKKYGKNVALKNVSFTINPGEITVLLGPNGAGKSTIMKSIIGFLKYEGEILLNGVITKDPETRRTLGYIPDLPSLYSNLTVREHMEFIARAYKMKDYKERIDELLKRFELNDKSKKFGDELSKGMQQKLNIALGLLPDPKIVLFDEPFIGLDPHAIRELKNIMMEMRSNGYGILVSTHIIDTMDELWDRTIIMQEGEVKYDITRDDLLKDGRSLENLFFDVTENVKKDDMTEDQTDYDKVPEKKVTGFFKKKKGDKLN